MIYLDHAATSLLKPPSVAQAVGAAIGQMASSSRGAYASALDAARLIYETRVMLAELFHCPQAEQVAFTANSTMALNMAIKGLLVPGDHVITTALEHNSVLRPLYEMAERGVELTIVPSDDAGNISYQALAAAVRPATRAIVCTQASNLTGNLVDLERVGAICRERGLHFVLDASQTAGVFSIDMERDHIAVVCFTGHKSLFGPQGTGGLCVRKDLRIRPLITGGSGIQTFSHKHPQRMPTRLEAGTLNGHGLAGLHAGLCYIKEMGLDSIRGRQVELLQRFYAGVQNLPGVKIYGDFSTWNRAAILSLNIGAEDSGIVSDRLSCDYDICTRSGGHCAPLMHEALGTVSQGAVRFSFSHFNTAAEIDQAIAAVKALAEE